MPLFHLEARISSSNLDAVEPVLHQIVGGAGVVTRQAGELVVRAELEGANARDLNRSLLTRLRSVEKRTRLRAEWIAEGVSERFFDYVPKGKPRTESPSRPRDGKP